MRTRVAVLLIPALVLAACGGGDDSSEASAEDWCSLAAEVDAAQADFDTVDDTDPAAVGEVLGNFKTAIDTAAKAAPDEILEDVNTAADGVDEFDSILSDVDYDFFALDQDGIDAIVAAGATIEPAVENIKAYNESKCGATADDDDDGDDGDDASGPDADDGADSGTVPPESTTTTTEVLVTPATSVAPTTEPTIAGDSGSAWCVANQELDDIGDQIELMFLSDPADLAVALPELLDELRALSAAAPAEISGDVAISLAGIEALNIALSEAGYDILVADLSVLDDLSDEMDVASDNIAAYNEEVCGIVDDDTEDEDDSDSAFDPSAGSIRDQTILVLVEQGFSELEAACIFDGIDFTDPAVGEDQGAIIALFDECGIDLARITEIFG